MSNVDEWASETPLTEVAVPAAEQEAVITPEFDVATLAGDFVQSAVQAAVRKRVAGIAAKAVKEALSDETLFAALEEQAQDAAEVAIADQLNPAPSPDPEPEGPPELHFGSVDQFVRGFLCHIYSRRINERSERVWAPDWWRYPEAVSRLESLWRAWEALRLEPATGMSVWWRDHADHHMNVLFDSEGPFKDARGRCSAGEPLPCDEPPASLFPDVREQPLESTSAT
ncbi:MAG: DUF4913 domain-containing protein [Intrasporangium sp.]|uniref:DUF4913 domain-containing protein n=1 Tax=Intrasporangium sp. TaxID=1925024 RepID=UPI00264938CD|nr:DUF4913 domain-containing protein [Intrasporangium sp.]MDN5797511.1 DUF4913 domain-containing protein [Intrasporangium sp.]